MARHYSELDSLRGLSALSVSAVHVFGAPVLCGATSVALLSPQINKGNVLIVGFASVLRTLAAGFGCSITPAVLMFFVLSGFVLANSLEAKGQDIAHFVIARFFRIVPPAWAAMLTFVVLFKVTGLSVHMNPWDFDLSVVVRNLLFRQVNLDGVLWSVQSELIAVPFIVAAYIIFKRLGIGVLILLAVFALFANMSVWWSSLLMDGNGPGRLAWIGAFWTGMVAFYVLQKCAFPSSRAIMVVGIVMFFGSTAMFEPSSPFIGIVACFGAALIIYNVVAPSNEPRRSLLRSPLLGFYGKISFSFYMLHPITLSVVWNMPSLLERANQKIAAPLLALGLWVATVVAITPLAWAMWRTVELGSIATGKRILRRMSRVLDATALRNVNAASTS